jgi:D-arginine dehydrogenase
MRFDFLVVGAGMAGASLTYELSRDSSVCLIEAEARPGMHATGRSAALFAPSYGGTEIRALTRASQAFFHAPPVGFSEQPLLRARGCLYMARPDQTRRLELMIEAIVRSGGEMRPIGKADALAMVPALRPDYLATAAFDRDAFDIDVDALHQGFLKGARAAGAVLKTDTRLEHVRREAGLWRVQAADETLEAAVLVNAAGAWADQVAVVCGARPLGLEPRRRTAMLVDPPPGFDISDWPAVIDADEQFYFKPDAGKLLLSPADETPDVPSDVQPDEIDVAIGVDRVQAALDIEVRRINHRWAGLRTFAKDRVPVLGFDPDIEGLFWLAGQGGYGIQTAPAMGRTAAALAQGRAAPKDVADGDLVVQILSPARFSEGAVRKVHP